MGQIISELTKKNLLYCMTVVNALVPNSFYTYKDIFLKGHTTHWASSCVVQKVLAGFNVLGACGLLRMLYLVYASRSECLFLILNLMSLADFSSLLER